MVRHAHCVGGIRNLMGAGKATAMIDPIVVMAGEALYMDAVPNGPGYEIDEKAFKSATKLLGVPRLAIDIKKHYGTNSFVVYTHGAYEILININQRPEQASRILWHELQHVAQVRGYSDIKGFFDLYSSSTEEARRIYAEDPEKAQLLYMQSPFEREAYERQQQPPFPLTRPLDTDTIRTS